MAVFFEVVGRPNAVLAINGTAVHNETGIPKDNTIIVNTVTAYAKRTAVHNELGILPYINTIARGYDLTGSDGVVQGKYSILADIDRSGIGIATVSRGEGVSVQIKHSIGVFGNVKSLVVLSGDISCQNSIATFVKNFLQLSSSCYLCLRCINIILIVEAVFLVSILSGEKHD